MATVPTSSVDPAAAVGSLRRPRSIAIYLFVLALVALVPAFAFSAILLQRNNEAQERVVETLITGSTRSIKRRSASTPRTSTGRTTSARCTARR